MMKQWLLFFSLFVFCLSADSCRSTSKSTETIDGMVVSIADGDTFTLLTPEKERVKIRLHGIDCPEKKQDFGQRARQKLSAMVFRKEVHTVRTDVDRYGRTVAIVYDDQNNCVNEELIKAGLAWHYKRYDHNPDWQQMEDDARASRVGLWSLPNPTPPWEWRRK